MNEIDFDELDKAVSSLMDKTKDKNTLPAVSPDDQELSQKVLEITPTSTEVPIELTSLSVPPSQIDSGDENTVPSDSKPAAESPVHSLATRRTGRFLDMVHPNADMKRTPTPISPVAPPQSSQRLSMTPRPVDGMIVRPTVAPTISPSQSIDEAIEESSVDESKSQIVQAETYLPALTVNQDAESSHLPSSSENTPLISPFLPDAKVEKRPLGGLAEDTPHVENGQMDEDSVLPISANDEPVLASTEYQVKTEDAPARLTLDPVTPAEEIEVESAHIQTQVPEELSSDLVAIESGEKESTERIDPIVPIDSKTGASQAPVASVPSPLPPSVTSIPQQYNEAPSSGDQSSGAIFDTTTYHQPLTHQAKRHPKWLWIVWVIIIIALGAIGGAAVYYFTTIA